MKIGITGYKGPVGQELLRYPNTFPIDVDVRNPQEIEMVIRSERPDLIFHLACISNVDECEKPENEKLVIETNLRGTFNVADVCYRNGCEIVLLSTDHVFDGVWGNYTEKNTPRPKNFYGHSKMSAEGLRTAFQNMKVIRTSKLFSNQTLSTDLGKMVAGESQEYPTFIYRTFMWLPHFASSVMEYAKRYDDMPNLLHISGSRTASYFSFMKEAASTFWIDIQQVVPRTKEIVGLSPRPFKGGLNTNLSKRLGLPQYSYMDGLREMMQEFLG